MTNRAMPPFELPPQSSTPASVTPVLNIAASILGQPWHWRSLAADARDPGYAPDDLVTQLLLARGCPRDAIDAHKAPSIRGFMPDPSILRDMDRAATRIADAVQARENIANLGDYDVDGATSAARMQIGRGARWGRRGEEVWIGGAAG